MAATISFRVSEDVLEVLRDQGEDPREVAREAFLEEARRRDKLAALERLTDTAKEPEEPIEISRRRGRR